MAKWKFATIRPLSAALSAAAILALATSALAADPASREDRIADRLAQREDARTTVDDAELRTIDPRSVIGRDVSASAPSAANPSAGQASIPQADAQHPAVFENDSLPLGVPSTSSPLPGNAGSKTDNVGDSGSWMLTTFSALAVVIGLIYGMRAVFVKMTGTKTATASSPIIEVLSRVSVAPRQHVLLLRLGDRVLLVSDSGNSMRTLTEITDPDEVAQLLQAVTAAKPNSMTQSFTKLLGGFNSQIDEHDEPLGEQGGDQGEVFVDRARDRLSILRSRLKTMSTPSEDA
jgi:flagellar biogenesis protein FliO